MKQRFLKTTAVKLTLILCLPATAGEIDGKAVLGGALGGGTGAAIGSALGGREGAIIGSGIGGAIGTAITAKKQRPIIVHQPVYQHGNVLPPGHYKHKYKHKHKHHGDRDDH